MTGKVLVEHGARAGGQVVAAEVGREGRMEPAQRLSNRVNIIQQTAQALHTHTYTYTHRVLSKTWPWRVLNMLAEL